jgi:CRISPR-associated protein Csb2
MNLALCITFRFIQPYPLFHGRGDGDEPEWPPSPMRAFQALLNAACLRTRGAPLPPELRTALQLIEGIRPSIIAPAATLSTTGHRVYVPHNQTDLVAAAWSRGNVDESIASHRIEKDVRAHRIEATGAGLPSLHYLYSLEGTDADADELLNAVRPAVRSIYCLGWGIDQVVADATLVDSPNPQRHGEPWRPTPRGGRRLRVHRQGSLEALSARHDNFLRRLVDGNWTPVPQVATVDYVRYRRDADAVGRPAAVFKLLDSNDDTVTYSNAKLIHIAGMVRHAAINAMDRNPPRELRGRDRAEWLESYVAGHRRQHDQADKAPHTQLSYVPMQSVATTTTDPGVRRVMIIAPVGDEAWLEHLASRLNGTLLKPLPNTALPPGTRLERVDDRRKDAVRDKYLAPAVTWASVTPVILPGHDDHKAEKTRNLIERALIQSGINQPCEFEWSAFSHFRKMLPAHKYRKDPSDPGKKILINYIRPDHLLEQSAVHLRLVFTAPVPGPLTIGAGRHCGFGLMASTE